MRVNLLDIQLIKYQHELRTSQYLLLGILYLIHYISVVSIQYGNQTLSHKFDRTAKHYNFKVTA